VSASASAASVSAVAASASTGSEANNDGKKRKLTMREQQEAGFLVCNQTHIRTYVMVAYVVRFKEPDESEWSRIAKLLSQEIGSKPDNIKDVFRKCRDGDANPELQRQGAGRPKKLDADNPGLKAAAIALNSGVPVSVAIELCNTQNKDGGITVCRNTVMNSLADYTDVALVATTRRKTGSKDAKSDWAVARKVLAEQLLRQIQTGEMLDKGLIATTGCDVPPVWWDGILWVDENHIRQVIGGNGHESSFSSKQYLIAMDPNTGELKPIAKGGKMPMRKQKTVPKYPQEARACYGVAVPTICGEQRPEMIQPWSYTGKKLISYNMWKQKVNQGNESKCKSLTENKQG